MDENQPLVIALLSDTHAQVAGSEFDALINGKLAQAATDLQSMSPDLWLCNGDVADHGYPGEYDAFAAATADAAPNGMLVNTGNHEFYDPNASDDEELQRFLTAFGLDVPYSSRVVADNVHLVLLADEKYKTAPDHREWAWLSEGQVMWFDQVLAEHPDLCTVVCLHQPLQDTVAGSEGGQGGNGCGQADQLRSILARYPQVKLWFSGHTHYRLERDEQVVVQDGVTFVALGSTAYLYTPLEPGEAPDPASDEPGYKKDWQAAQSRVLEIWPDRLVIRAWDHTAQTWLDDLELTILRS